MPDVELDLEIKGLKETQDRLVQLLAQVTGHGWEAIVSKATLRAHRYATMITHVDTGRLKNSLFPRVHSRGNTAYGVIGTNVVYAPYEHARGGSHAFFARTVDEEGPAIVDQVNQDVAAAVREAGE